LVALRSIDLRIAQQLKEREFRKEWFRSELETAVPNLFRELRERRKMTQSQLAEVTDMKQSAISRFESSTDAKWKFETLLRMAEALDARLFIGLEASEDVIEKTNRQELKGSFITRSAADHVSQEDLNTQGISALNHSTQNLVGLKSMLKKDSTSWN
jgi:transcriptional regulator with XRE-family HTH domain